jgi:hypothetical protein
VTSAKALLRRLRKAQVEGDRIAIAYREARTAAEEAERLASDTRAAEDRWWDAWMKQHHPDGRDPLHRFFQILERPDTEEYEPARPMPGEKVTYCR